MNQNVSPELAEKYGADLAKIILRIMIWIENNPKGYEVKGYEDIAKESKNSLEEVQQYFEVAMAELNPTGLPPSQFEGLLKSNNEIFWDSPEAEVLVGMHKAGCSNKDIAFKLGLPLERVSELVANLVVGDIK